MSRVLIAEDSPSIRLLLTRRLEMAGHVVAEARDGAEALAMLESAPDDGGPEILLLDAMMPNTDGPTVLRHIKQADWKIPVLVVSAVAGLSRSEEWQEADGHVSKPIDFEYLLDRIEVLTSARPQP